METLTKIICITCPKGCSLEVTHDGQTVIKVKPGCKRGKEYVQRELTDPRRMVATTVRIKGGLHPLLPVATDCPIPETPHLRPDGCAAWFEAARSGDNR